MSQYGQVAYVTDVLDMQGFDPVIAEYVDNLGESMGKSLDLVVRNILVAGTNVQYASVATTRWSVGSGMYFNDAELREGVRTLRRNDTEPIEGDNYVAIVHPDTVFDFFADATVRNAFLQASDRGSSNPLFTGVIGTYYRTRFVETTQARIFTSAADGTAGLSGANVYVTLLFGKGWAGTSEFGAAAAKTYIEPAGSAGTSDPLHQINSIGWKASKTAVVLNQNFGVRIEHVTSVSNTG